MDVLQSWCTELDLSRPVSTATLGADFRSGFLFGEILSLHNQLGRRSTTSSSRFIDSDHVEAIRSNYYELQKPLTALGIRLSASEVTRIVDGDTKLVARLLYEIFAALSSSLSQASGRDQPVTALRVSSTPWPLVTNGCDGSVGVGAPRPYAALRVSRACELLTSVQRNAVRVSDAGPGPQAAVRCRQRAGVRQDPTRHAAEPKVEQCRAADARARGHVPQTRRAARSSGRSAGHERRYRRAVSSKGGDG